MHPDIDPDGIVQPSTLRNGRMEVPIEWGQAQLPRTPITRVLLIFDILRQQFRETPTSKGVILTFTMAVLVMATSAWTRAKRLKSNWTHHPYKAICTACMFLALTAITLLLIDALSGRLLSETIMQGRTMHEIAGADRHKKAMKENNSLHGFNNLGAPV